MAALRKLLQSLAKEGTLANLFEVAVNAACPWKTEQAYEPILPVFCDGFRIKMGLVKADNVRKYIVPLKNFILSKVTAFVIKELVVSASAAATYLWLMPANNNAAMTSNLIMHL